MRKALPAVVAALLSSPAFAETLIDNARGLQVGPDGQLQRFKSLVINRAGKIIQVVRDGQTVVVPIDRRVDVQGRTLLPGFIDAHVHLTQLGLKTTQISLDGTSSLEDLKARLARFAAENPDQRWITGRGWNEEIWPEKRFPTAADLDAVVPDRPVWLYRIDGHGAVANSAALREAGISRSTADPEGGHITRDEAGNPTGFVIEAARELVESRIPAMTEAELDSLIGAAQDILLSNGITSVANLRTSAEDWASLKRLGAGARLQVRVIAYAHGLDALNRMAEQRPTSWLFGDHLRLTGVKFYSDGALGSRGAWLKKPYADAPEASGLSLLGDAAMERETGEAARRGFQVALHAIGDAANSQAISIFEKLGKAYPGDRRWRIEHFQIADPADIPRLAPAGIIASMQPIHQVSDRRMAEARLGPARLAGAYAWNSVRKTGARLAFGSDTPFDTPSALAGLSAAISRQDINSDPAGGWIPSERLTFERALEAYTRDAAYAGFAEQKVGALEPGKWADFIIVDRDVSAADPQALARTQVLETWVAGKKVWSGSASAAGERGK